MLTRFFYATAWPMEVIAPYSPAHIITALSGVILAAFWAGRLAGLSRVNARFVLFSCGLFLSVSELYKQFFLYLVVYGRRYEWWYFPFQLCSIPMYVCLAFPFLDLKPGRRKKTSSSADPARALPSPLQKAAAAFLQDFGLLGGIMALAVPDGFLHPYWTLTIHGFLWHFILVFAGLYCGFKGLADTTSRGYAKAAFLYWSCCLAACGINTAVQKALYPADYANMFYINCFFPSEQPLFRQLSLTAGNIWGHLAYLAASCLGALLIHRLFRIFLQQTTAL